MRAWKCDLCGEYYTTNRSIDSTRKYRVGVENNPGVSGPTPLDICHNCYYDLEKFFESKMSGRKDSGEVVVKPCTDISGPCTDARSVGIRGKVGVSYPDKVGYMNGE